MKKINTIIFILLLMTVVNFASAETNHREEDRAVLKGYLSKFEQALNDNDIEQVTPLLDENVVIVFVNAEEAVGVPEIIAYHEKVLGESNGLLKKYSTKAQLSAPAKFFDDTAVAHGTTLDTYTLSNNDVIEMQTAWTATLVKNDNSQKWKISQLHFSANPFSNQVMDTIQNKVILVGVICGFIGLLIGLLIRRLKRK